MTPTQLRTYAAIARNGTSKAAAIELNVSEAAVSGHVASLRKELGDELFRRSGSGIDFTPGGLRLAARAAEMLGLQEQTRYEVSAAAAGQRVLRLAVSSLFAECAAPGLIELFSTRADDIAVEMSVVPPDQYERLLITRAIDAAIGPAISSTPSKINSNDFLRYQLVAVVGKEHQLAHSRTSSRQMARQRWLLGPSAVDASSGAGRMLHHFSVPEANQHIFQNHAAALTESRAGKGLALCPSHMLSAETADGRLVEVDSAASTVHGTWSTFVLRQEHQAALTSELVRFVSTPRAIQAMLTGSGANIRRFRPRVHVTLWS